MLRSVCRFLRSDDGPTAIEYAFLAGLILAVVIAAVSFLGSTNAQVWTNTAADFTAVMP